MTMYKARVSMVAVGIVVLTGFVGLAQPKGTTVTIKGEAVDLWCYMEGGDRGPAKKECATACAKAGNSIGIVDAKGTVYGLFCSSQDRRSIRLDQLGPIVDRQ